MTTPRLTYCQMAGCSRFWGPLIGPRKDPVLCCEAFPKGIPEHILSGDNSHTEKVEGDGGLRFESVEVGSKGGAGSGNWGHAGRPGLVGGSGGTGGGALGSFRQQGALEQFRGGIRIVGDTDSPNVPDKIADKLMSWAGRHDPRVLESMDKLYVAEDMTAWARDHYEAFGPNATPEDTAGWAHGSNVHLRPGGGRREVFDHEMGHVAWNASGATRTWSQQYYKNDNFDRHTEYSRRGGKGEAFAEAYMSYVKTGGVSKSARYAATYAAVEEVINGIR